MNRFSDLQNGGRPPSWICCDVTVLHRRTHFRCANIVLKFLVNQCCSFIDICNIIRQPFLAVHNGLWQFWSCACTVSREPSREVQNNHSYEFFDPYLPIHYATFMRLQWRLRGVLRGASPLLTDFRRKFCPVKNGPQNDTNSGKSGFNIRFYVRDPEKAILAQNLAFCVFCVKIRPASCLNPKN